MSTEITRRFFLGSATAAVSAATLGRIGVAEASTKKQSAAKASGSHTSFSALKQIDAGLLNVGYAEAGPATGTPVILLHGWPYDIHSYVDVTPLLAAAGYRVIIPYLRGYGTTRFLSADTMRNGQQAVVGLDIIALMDALKIPKAIIAGFDNPDHVDIVIHNYRWRLSLAKGESKYDELENKLFAGPVIAVPTLTLASDFDGPGADGKAYAGKFSGKYSHRVLKGIGHNVPQEAPQAFAQAVIDVDAF